MIILIFLTPAILFLLSYLIGSGKATNLMIHYYTLPEEKKDKIDEKALSKFVGKLLFVLGVILLILPIHELLNSENLDKIMIVSNIEFVTVLFAGILHIYTSSKFKK